MKASVFLTAVSPVALLISAPVSAGPASADVDQSATTARDSDTITTGVAKGRDRLDSATSTSVLRNAEIENIGARSVGDLLRSVPGLRSEASAGEGAANISIRGLPIASSGAKFVQLQEDGLPVLEFGDILGNSADTYLRPDLGLRQVEVIRGGSASTFASNSPGGIINFISKTGDVEGGSIALTAGLDYDQYRADFDYGAHVNDTLRYHVGGFYRQGEGPRRAGYDAQKGGQIKLNVTKEFAGGYVRFYGKYLDDRTPYYDNVPVRATGSNDKPHYELLPNFDVRHDVISSRYLQSNLSLDRNNDPTLYSVRDGQRTKVAAFGVETQADVSGWTVTDRFRYAGISGALNAPFSSGFLKAGALSQLLGGPGATLSYANGPQAGMRVTDPTQLAGNGVLANINLFSLTSNSLDNVTNDIRASRAWPVGGGDLTTTVGFYASRQTIDTDLTWTTLLSEVRGNGDAALINLSDATGRLLTQNGVYAYNFFALNGAFRRSIDVDYRTNAPFASLNYHVGRVAIGGSLRYDYGGAHGQVFGSELGGGRVGTVTRDLNGDGVISPAERLVAATPLATPAPVDYDFGYLSYSTGINFRLSEPLAVFARYSRGARANADRILFTPIVRTTDGSLQSPGALEDGVKQAEVGLKFRREELTLNLTGFWAKVKDTNLDTTSGTTISRLYRATGVEFEGGIRHGVLSLTAGATYTDATILDDQLNPAIEGNTPRHQAKLIFQATPQVTTDRFSIGAVLIGTTGSFARDDNILRMPGYVTANGFVQVRASERLTLSLNANNMFNALAFTGIDTGAIPASGIVPGRVLNGRTVSATMRIGL